MLALLLLVAIRLLTSAISSGAPGWLNLFVLVLAWDATRFVLLGVSIVLSSGLRARVVPYVGAPQPWIRAAALQALARIDREELALVLSGLDPDPEWSGRAALATALGLAGDEVSA